MSEETFGIKEFMQEFKNFLDHEGIGSENYSDEAYEMVELLSLYDSFVQRVAEARKELMQEQAQNNDKQEKNSPSSTSDNVTRGNFKKE